MNYKLIYEQMEKIPKKKHENIHEYLKKIETIVSIKLLLKKEAQ